MSTEPTATGIEPAPPGPPEPRAAGTPASRPVVAVVGNPNTGKSTLFNALTGLRQKVANYPGVTVEKHLGQLRLANGREVELVDLPGVYSLSAHSPDELIALDVLLGGVDGVERPRAVLVTVDASNLRRNLFLVTQVLELGMPVVVVLNMMDLAERRGLTVDVGMLEERLGARVVPVVASKGRGIDAVRAAVAAAVNGAAAPTLSILPALREVASRLSGELAGSGVEVPVPELERALVDGGGAAEARLVRRAGSLDGRLAAERGALLRRLGGDGSLAATEALHRYGWIGGLVAEATVETPPAPTVSERLDRVLSHPIAGLAIFLALMATLFQAVFSWATPAMDGLEEATAAVGAWVAGALPAGALHSLVADGVFAGVGSVIVFLPQILLLFTFIILLEDSGYMARAAFMMDRVMRGCGLSGQSFIPMLSSFACAVPGILGTRVIPDRRDRLATILAAPFMTCSARLPVYALLIAAFVPERRLAGVLSLRGTVLLGLYLLGIAGGVATALLLKRTALRGRTPTFLMEMPPYRWPNPRAVLTRLWERGRIFLQRAGTVIFSVAVVVWSLAYFPHPGEIGERYATARRAATARLDGEALAGRLAELDHQEAAAYLESSFLGRAGRAVEPAFRPLGWDWRVAAAVIAAFPAREVVIAVLGTIYAVGPDVDAADAGLVARLHAAHWPDGRPVFTVPVALGLMVFFAFCLQCVSTVVIIRRETNSWRWPLFAWSYMTGLAYVATFLTYRLGTALLGGA